MLMDLENVRMIHEGDRMLKLVGFDYSVEPTRGRHERHLKAYQGYLDTFKGYKFAIQKETNNAIHASTSQKRFSSTKSVDT